MRAFLIRTQLLIVSVLLLLTMVLMMIMVTRHNQRWDFTREGAYTLAEPTADLLEQMREHPVQVLAFYPQEDPSRDELEVFFRQMKLRHPGFEYRFYDPDRTPLMTRELGVDSPYTVIINYREHSERVVMPTEQSFANALLRLANPKDVKVCFTTGHGQASLVRGERTGYSLFRTALKQGNYTPYEIILSRDGIPDRCQIVMVAGPHRDLNSQEYTLIKTAFEEGQGVFFLIDPMDPGTGESFRQFMLNFGILLGTDVIVDKMGRIVGGDFLVPVVSRYVEEHPVSKEFQMPTVYPVARSVQPSTDPRPDIEVTPLAFTGSGSWGETDLRALERGEAVFNPEADLPGPLPIAAAAEHLTRGGRMIVVGDSDFLTNAYIDVAGNRGFAMRMIQWLSKDDRLITIPPRHVDFQPLFMTPAQNFRVFLWSTVFFPVFFLLTGALMIFIRKKTS